MELHQGQKTVAVDTHRFRVVDAGRRFGKDVLGIEEAIGIAIANPGVQVVYIAPTIQQVRDIVWQPLKTRVRPIATSINETRLEITIKTRGAEDSLIILRGWEAIETLRGTKNAFVVLTEVAMMRNFWIGWQEVIRPTLTDLKGGALFLSTPKGYNHFYALHEFEKNKEVNVNDEWRSFHFTTYDNPHIDPKEVDAARATLTEDRFAQEYLAEFRKMEGLVYKEFDRFKHVFDDLTPRPPLAEILGGVDFGYTNPSCILRIEHDVDNHYWVTSEWYKTGKTTAELIEVAKTLKINLYYPDPAEPDRIEEMSRAGLNIREVSKDIEAGIQSVRELFKQGRLHIHKDCVNLINELETYRYPETRPDKNAPEVPVKENDHAVDALRYPLHNNAPALDDTPVDFSLYGASYD